MFQKVSAASTQYTLSVLDVLKCMISDVLVTVVAEPVGDVISSYPQRCYSLMTLGDPCLPVKFSLSGVHTDICYVIL